MNKQLEQVSRVTTECSSFVWKIENFPSLQAKTGEFVRSSVVKCSNSHWCVKLFPNGKYIKNQVEIYFEYVGISPLQSLPNGVGYKIGLRNRSGENCFELFPVTVTPSASSKNEFESSTNVSLESVHTAVTTDASSTHASLTSTTSSSSSFSFGAVCTASSPLSSVSFPETTTAPSSLAKNNCTSTTTSTAIASGFWLNAVSLSPGKSISKADVCSGNVTKSKSSGVESISRNTSRSDKPERENSIQPQPLVLQNISTKEPNFCFLNEKEKSPNSAWTSKSACFLEANKGMVLPRERLFKMADDLLPNDVLTVVCEMEVTVVVKVSESTLVNESTSSNNGTKLLIENLQNAFENPRFSDVTLKVGDVQFPAHKIILANRSKVFDAMFDSEMKESQENVVNLVEMKPSVAKAMLSYIYSGSIQELSVDRATDLYVAADRYDMPELKQWCKDFILKHISPNFACDVAILANLHDDEELAKASKHTIKNNLKAVLSSEKWLSLSKESPAVYLELLQVALLDDSD